MILLKPKLSTYISLSAVVLMLLLGLILMLRDFTYSRSFGLWFYLVGCSLLTLVLLMLFVKMMAGWRFISAGKEQVVIKLPLRGSTKVYPVAEILAWEEETVLANKREFKQVTLVFKDRNSISVSNHEHEAYTEFINYLKKKAPKPLVKPKKSWVNFWLSATLTMAKKERESMRIIVQCTRYQVVIRVRAEF